MFFRFALLLAFCCGLLFVGVAQPIETVRVKTLPGPYLRFDPFTVNNEALKKASNKSMQLHDSQGYLWFLSELNDGYQLLRYDGTYYKSFGGKNLHLYGSSSHLLSIDIGLVKENEDNEIWVATDNGLSRFDPTTETFRAFRNPFTKQQAIAYWVMGKDGKNWFSHTESLGKRPIMPFFEFNSRTRQFRTIYPARLVNGYTNQTERQQNVSFAPKSVDDLGRIWGEVNTTKANVGYFDFRTNALVWYPISNFLIQESEKGENGLNGIFDIWSDGRYAWVSSLSRMGLLRLDVQTARWKQFYFSSTSYNRVWQIVARNTHQFWLQTDESPVLFDTDTETLYTYPHLPDNPFTPHQDARPYVMSQKALWLGLYSANDQATFRVMHDEKQPFRLWNNNYVESQVLYKNERKLYYTEHSATQLTLFEEDERTHTKIALYAVSVNKFLQQVLQLALHDQINQTLWLVGNTSDGTVFRYDEKKRQVKPVKATIRGLPPGENQLDYYDDIRAIVQDKVGIIWLPAYGAHGGGNLIKFNTSTQQFEGFRAGTHGLPIGQIRSAMVDSTGLIWLGYGTGGPVYQFDPVTNRATVVLETTHRDGTDATKILNDPARKKVWIARSADGIWQYDWQTRSARRVSQEEVYGKSFYLKKQGIIWFKTADALVRFDPETGQKKRFGTEYDLHDFRWHSLIKMADDEFFFEKFRFYDQGIKPDTVKPIGVFSFLKVFDKELQLSQSLNFLKMVSLNYDQNFFTVGFSVLSYFQSEHNQYAYQLVPFNKEWVNVGNKPLAVFSNVPPGHYQLHIKGSNNDGIWSDVKTISIHIIPPFWQTWWFRVFVFLLLIAAVFMVYRFQLERRTLKARLEAEEAKRKQTEAELNEKEAAFQLKLSQTEMAALRSQMNPHFIFNCLNSIQFFTAQNDTEKASDYLTKFSRLIRLVLENSKSERVTLANELETLRLYIEMEAMRFQQKLHYEIRIDEEIDAESVQIPPLLLQPFVENAIWHGLMQKEEGGIVWVEVQQPRNGLLHVKITDDGVGRQQAADYKSRSATKNKSFGMKITADRIELINQLYQTNTQVQVIDLADEQGNPTGTQVIVDIPI